MFFCDHKKLTLGRELILILLTQIYYLHKQTMSAYKRYDVYQLLEESKRDENIVTIEATVVTGFEGAALEECLEKCKPMKSCRAQGRIFFNVAVEDFEKASKLRAVDNLLLVNDAIQTLELVKNKEDDLEYIKSLVHVVDWGSSLKTWAKLTKFEGVLYPLKDKTAFDTPGDPEGLPFLKSGFTPNVTDSTSPLELNNIEKKWNGNITENNSSLLEEISKVKLSEKKGNDGNKLNDSNLQKKMKARKISESSDDMYFSAEEIEIELPNEEASATLNKLVKNPVDANVLKFRATCNRVGDHSFSSMEAAACFGGALNDKFNWTVDLTNFDLNVILNINKGACYICSAITEKSLHRRNITHFGYVTLRSTMCYNLVRLAEPVRGEIIVDPLCGGGSIPIEGSLGFPNTFHICGDNDNKAMSRTQANVEHIRKSDNSLKVDPIKWSARRLPLKDSSVDVCVTDLPFGKRSGKKVDNLPLYRDVLHEMARVTRCGTARAVLLTHDKKSFTKAMSGLNNTYWRQIRTITVNQGGLFSTVFLLLRTAKPFLR